MTSEEFYEKIIRMQQKHQISSTLKDIQAEYIQHQMIKICRKDKKIVSNIRYKDMLESYNLLKNTTFQNRVDAMLTHYKFQYSASIREAILTLHSKESGSILPTFWPGVFEVKDFKEKQLLKTIKGLVTVHRASTYFQKENSSKVFSKPLASYCYDRTYEFLQLNPDYAVVFSWMPELLLGGHYHVYLKKKNITLDIASDALYQENSFKIPLHGKIFKIATKEEIEDTLRKEEALFSILPWKSPLYLLCHYYDIRYHQAVNAGQKLVRK